MATTGRDRPHEEICWYLLLVLALSATGVSFGQSAPPTLRSATAVTYDAVGNLYIADAAGQQVLEATLAGDLVVVAGTGVQGFSGDGGAAGAAQLNSPRGIAVASDGSVYIADTGNRRIRAVSPGGQITTVVGMGVAGQSVDGTPALQVRLSAPTALGLDPAGNLVFCDTGNHQVRKITEGVVATVAGIGAQGFLGDGGPAGQAELSGPEGLAIANDGTVFLADTRNGRVRRVTTDGVITTVAGDPLGSGNGGGIAAVSAKLQSPRGLALQTDGTLLIADGADNRLRKLSPSGLLTTLAGTGVEGKSSEAAPAAASALETPRGVAVSPLGYVLLAQSLPGTVQAVAGQAKLYQPAAFGDPRSSHIASRPSSQQLYGQGTLAATVSGPVDGPAGTLQLLVDGGVWQRQSLATGAATFDLTTLAAGSHQLRLHYGGDGLNPATDGAPTSFNVQPLSITALADPATIPYGELLPALNGVLLGVLPQDQGKVTAAFTVGGMDLPTAGSYPIAVVLSGASAGNYTAALSAGSGRLTVTRAAAVATVTSSGPSYAGMPMTLQAVVKPPARGVPTGTVQFLDGTTVVASSALVNGAAEGVYAAPPLGPRTLSVQYGGDANFLPSTSANIALTVSPLPDFAMAPSGPAAATATAGAVTVFLFSVNAQPGPFTGAVSFSASGLPPDSSLSFSPPQVIPGSESVQVTATIQTAPTTQAAGQVHDARKRPMLLFGVALGCVGLMGGRRQRLWQVRLVFCFGLATLCTGCGARTVTEGGGAVLSQSYPVQITGTATNLAGSVVTHSATFTLTVLGGAGSQ